LGGYGTKRIGGTLSCRSTNDTSRVITRIIRASRVGRYRKSCVVASTGTGIASRRVTLCARAGYRSSLTEGRQWVSRIGDNALIGGTFEFVVAIGVNSASRLGRAKISKYSLAASRITLVLGAHSSGWKGLGSRSTISSSVLSRTVTRVSVTFVRRVIANRRGLRNSITASTNFRGYIAKVSGVTSVDTSTSRTGTESTTTAARRSSSSLASHRDQVIYECIEFVPVVGSKHVVLYIVGHNEQLGFFPDISYTDGKNLQTRYIGDSILHGKFKITLKPSNASGFTAFGTSCSSYNQRHSLYFSCSISNKIARCVFLQNLVVITIGKNDHHIGG
jgi:hypothetical protein